MALRLLEVQGLIEPIRTPSGQRVFVQVLAEGNRQMECNRFQLAPGAASEGAYRYAGRSSSMLWPVTASH